jgi:hypothetical protein
VWARFSAPVQTGPGARPASYTLGTGVFPGLKRPMCGVNYPPPLAQRLKKWWNYSSTPPLGLRGLFYGEHLLVTLITTATTTTTTTTTGSCGGVVFKPLRY